MTDSLIKSFIKKLDTNTVYTYNQLVLLANSLKENEPVKTSKESNEPKEKKRRYTPDKKDKEYIEDIFIARKYYWNSMKKDGTSYTDFCSIWDNMTYGEKYSMVDYFETSVKSYKSAKIKPVLNDEDKDYDYDPKLHKIILGRKCHWDEIKIRTYNDYPFEQFENEWTEWDFDDKENMCDYYDGYFIFNQETKRYTYKL